MCACVGRYYTLFLFFFLKKTKLSGQCHFLWHQSDTQNLLYLDDMDAEIFYSKGLSRTEAFHSERTKPPDCLERNTDPNDASLFLATHLFFLFWIGYQAQYYTEKGIQVRSECWCLTKLVVSICICFQRWLDFTGEGTLLVSKHSNVRGL